MPGSATVELFGVMCDGTVVLGCTEMDGSVPSVGGLDSQGGHVHDLVDLDGQTLLSDRYHTHVCPSESSFTHAFTPEIAYYDSCSVN